MSNLPDLEWGLDLNLVRPLERYGRFGAELQAVTFLNGVSSQQKVSVFCQGLANQVILLIEIELFYLKP